MQIRTALMLLAGALLAHTATTAGLLGLHLLPGVRDQQEEMASIVRTEEGLRARLPSMATTAELLRSARTVPPEDAVHLAGEARAVLQGSEPLLVDQELQRVPEGLRPGLATAIDLHSRWTTAVHPLLVSLELGRRQDLEPRLLEEATLRAAFAEALATSHGQVEEALAQRRQRVTELLEWALGWAAAWVLLGIGLVLLGALGLRQRLFGPLQELSAALDRVAGGDLEVRLPERGDEVGRLAHHLNAATGVLRRRAEEREGHLARSEALLNRLLHHARDLVLTLDGDRRIAEVGPACEDLLGLPAERARGRRLVELFAPEEAERVERSLGGRPGEVRRELLRREGGSELKEALELTAVAFEDDAAGRGHVVQLRDVTEALRREAQLQQAQKMEVVGQLTGGVAHDFNNLLTVVLGNLELARTSLGSSWPGELDGSVEAALRASELTRRLLAYARRQPLEPEVVDPSERIAAAAPLLRRAIPESVELELEFEPGLWTCLVDPHQLDSALLNLVVNARDAMPEGGRVEVRAGNVRLEGALHGPDGELAAGRYVCITVADDGVGMSAEVLQRASEPFFTTKETGRGSGLGLSMVSGFAHQSGGQLVLESAPGRGTRASVYLPAASGSPASPAQEARPAPRGRGEHVLVVEDDARVRELLEAIVTHLGYRVTVAADGPSALGLAEELGDVEVLLTDVILPGGLNGPEVARRLCARFPHVRVVLTSGYTENALAGLADPAMPLLHKPFRAADVALALERARTLAAARARSRS